MSKQLHIQSFFKEPSTVKSKVLRDINSAFSTFLLDPQLSKLSNFSCFFITILFKELNHNYNFYWTQLQLIIDQLILFFQPHIPVFFSYGIELHRNNKPKIKQTNFKNQVELNFYNKKHKTNYTFIDNKIFEFISENKLHSSNKLENLPHLHIIIGLNNYKKKLDSNLLIQDLFFYFKEKYDIQIDNLNEYKYKNKIEITPFYNIVNSFNYIWKNYNVKDVQYNLSLFYNNKLPTFGLYCFNSTIFQFFKVEQIKLLQSFNINIFQKILNTNTEFEKYFYTSSDYLAICINEFITFMFNYLSNYRFDSQFNLYILKKNTKHTFILLLDSFDLCLNYLYKNKGYLTHFYFSAISNTSNFKLMLNQTLNNSNYPFFQYNGFEFLDVLLDHSTMSILKKNALTSEQKTLSCFLYYPYNFKDYISLIINSLPHLQLKNFFYYNNLSFDFFFFLGLMFNKLSSTKNFLLKVNIFFFGRTGTVKSNFTENLLLNLFSTQKDYEFIRGEFGKFSSFQSQLLDKPIYILEEFHYNTKTASTLLHYLSDNTTKNQEVKFEKARSIKTHPIAFFTDNTSPCITIFKSINKRHKSFTTNFIPFFEATNTDTTYNNYKLYLNDLLRFTEPEIDYFFMLLYLKFNPENYLTNLKDNKFSLKHKFTKDTHTFFQSFNNYIYDFIHAEENAFLRRLLVYNFDTPIEKIFPISNSLATFCQSELPFFYIISWILTSLSFYSTTTNIKDFITEDQFKIFWNFVYELGTHKHNTITALIKPDVFFYNIPIKFQNTSWHICNRLNLKEYESYLESLFSTYITDYNNHKTDFNNFLINQNPNHKFLK